MLTQYRAINRILHCLYALQSMFVTLTLNNLTVFSSCGFCSGLRRDYLGCHWESGGGVNLCNACCGVLWCITVALVNQCWSVLTSVGQCWSVLVLCGPKCVSDHRRASLTAVTNDCSGRDVVRSSAARWHSLPSCFVVAIPINLPPQRNANSKTTL